MQSFSAVDSGPLKLKTLATPKFLPAAFHEDRHSVYWENGIPSKDFSKRTGIGKSATQTLTECVVVVKS